MLCSFSPSALYPQQGAGAAEGREVCMSQARKLSFCAQIPAQMLMGVALQHCDGFNSKPANAES